ncbi:hypothetical protein MWH25_04805 [Natroniella acetigena]|uniref:hypothetical protein n=1 Tax=Natroniella acetigena TaxID=52004 RepID=UPI00200B7ED7|nr:hypothetical protein [Natroniella acetigena]MCK8827066.1 hypothetical protein [Natroniella acetigena]
MIEGTCAGMAAGGVFAKLNQAERIKLESKAPIRFIDYRESLEIAGKKGYFDL